MARRISALTCAVFGTAVRLQAKFGIPAPARHVTDAISWGTGVMALWLWEVPGWVQAILFLVVVNGVAWLVTAIYFLVWGDRIHQFRRMKVLVRQMVTDAERGQTENVPSFTSAAATQMMERLTRANVLIRKGFSHRIHSDYEAFKTSEVARRGSNDLWPVIAEYGTRLMDEMRFSDLNPDFTAPRTLSDIDPWTAD